MANKKKPLLTEKRWNNLQPFLFRKEARQRVILYLIAAGYSVGDLMSMKVSDLKALSLHEDIIVSRDEMLFDLKNNELAFVYPSGKLIPHTYYYRLLRYSGLAVKGRKMSQETFRASLD